MKFKINSELFEDLVEVKLSFYLNGSTKVTFLLEEESSIESIEIFENQTYLYDFRYFSATRLLECPAFILLGKLTDLGVSIYQYEIDFSKVIVEKPSDYIVRLLNKKGLLKKDIAKVLKCSNQTLHRIANENNSLYLDNIFKIARFLAINPKELIDININYQMVTQLTKEYNSKYINELYEITPVLNKE